MLRYLKLFPFIMLAMFVLIINTVIAQSDTTSTLIPNIEVPEGFNWFYLGFFILGMLIHYVYKVYKVLGSVNLLKGLLNNFVGWFINKFHRTLLAGFVAAILGLVEYLGLSINFSTITFIGAVVAIAAGYIGDLANAGEIK